jgi:hypothetical protein
MIAEPLSAMISYSWVDSVAAELFHEELALRGFDVFHDRCSFPLGSRIGRSMADAVARCDAFVVYLTPSSLYLDKPHGAPRPAIDNEFLPVMRRWRFATSASARDVGAQAAPIIAAVTHGLGDPREEAPQVVLKATGEDISSLWMPVLDQTTTAITQPEAATVARDMISAVFAARRPSHEDGQLQMLVTTRGQGQVPHFLTVDGTRLLGGPETRPGTPSDWDRFLAGIRDLQTGLAHWTVNRRLRVVARAHITACLATGRVFNQAAGWRLTVAGRHGDGSMPTELDLEPPVESYLDPIGGPGAMTIEIDMIGGNVTDLATRVIQDIGSAPRARLQIWRKGTGDMLPTELQASAATSSPPPFTYFAHHPPSSPCSSEISSPHYTPICNSSNATVITIGHLF